MASKTSNRRVSLGTRLTSIFRFRPKELEIQHGKIPLDIDSPTSVVPTDYTFLEEKVNSLSPPHLDPILSDEDDAVASCCSSDKNVFLNASYHSYDPRHQTLGIPIQVEINSEEDVTGAAKMLMRDSSSVTLSQVLEDSTSDIPIPPLVGSIKGSIKGDTVKFDFSSASFSSEEDENKMAARHVQQEQSLSLEKETSVKETSAPVEQISFQNTTIPINTTTTFDTDVDETIDKNTPITCGMYVDIIGGTYKGKTGARVIKVMNKMVRLQIPGDATERNVQKSSIQPRHTMKDATTSTYSKEVETGSESPTTTTHVPPMEHITIPTPVDEQHVSEEPPSVDTAFQSNIQKSGLSLGSVVDVVGGLYKGTKSAVIVKITDKMVRVRLPGTSNEKMVKKQSVQLSKSYRDATTGMNLDDEPLDADHTDGVSNMAMECGTIPSDENTDSQPMSDFKILDGDKTPFMIGNFYMVRVIASSIKPDPNCFLEYQWSNRLMVKDVRLKENVSIETTIKQNGCILQLVSAKIYSDTTGFSFQSQDYLRVAYAIVSGPHIQTRGVKDELLKIGDFASLSTSKVVSRLELLQSPAHKLKGKSAIHILDSSLFCNIEETGHVGCGFISEEMMYQICGSIPTAKRVTCIQVRLIIPRLGIFKGVLMRKQIQSGPPIQLPSSMRKVGPSSDPTYAQLAFLLICQAGMDPSSNNIYVGRLPSINPSAKPPPASFRVNPLSDMITRLFKGLKVPSTVVDEYAKQSSRVSGLKHAFVRGVADPTGKIPSGSIYLTGIARKDILGDFIFITRSPCIKCSDARSVPVVRDRPGNMSEDEWNFLESLHFGSVIFGFPEKGYKTLPEMIASGDLDGDRYFVCWSDIILKHIVLDALENTLVEEEETKPVYSNPAWFEDAQRVMIDSARRNAVGQLIGKLYMLSLKAADESDLFMRDPKSIAFADAYTDALDNFKHGNKILLPKELHDSVPQKLRIFLAPKDPEM